MQWNDRCLINVGMDGTAGRAALELLGKAEKGVTESDEERWAAHIDELLEEMDGTTAHQFAVAVGNENLAVLGGLAELHKHCRSRAARTKCLEGIMSVCAVVPDGYLSMIARPGAVGEVVQDACCASSDTVRGNDEEEVAAMHDLYAVVLLGQLVEFLLDRADHSVSLSRLITRQQENEGGLNEAEVASKADVDKVR